MNLVKLSEYFEIKYGVNLEFQSMKLCNKGIPFVSRGAKNNGVVGFVEIKQGIVPNPKNTISVACGGSIMESFLQKNDYYSGRDLFYLKPRILLTDEEMLYYCACLRSNKYRYNYGRQANKTLAELSIPNKDSIPRFVYEQRAKSGFKLPSKESHSLNKMFLDDRKWGNIKLFPCFFDMKAGSYYAKHSYQSGRTPLISSSSTNNGVMAFTDIQPVFTNSITIGKIKSSAFFQEYGFVASSDVTVLVPTFELNNYIAIFLVSILNRESFKWSYGRQIRLNDCQKLKIKLPITKEGVPDWQFMEDYIKSLPYSFNLKSE